jgi:hypothetical protein
MSVVYISGGYLGIEVREEDERSRISLLSIIPHFRIDQDALKNVLISCSQLDVTYSAIYSLNAQLQQRGAVQYG